MPNDDKGFFYRLIFRADTKGAKDASKALDDLDKKSKTAGQGKAGFFARLRQDADELQTRFPLLRRAFDGLALVAKGPIAAVVGGFVAIAGAIKGATVATRAYLAESLKLNRFDGILAQQGRLTKALRQDYIDLASQLQKTTGIADDQWIDVLGKLTQFGARPETIGIDIQAVKNLAAVFNGDLRQATSLYTRALQDQFGQFRELGFNIDLTATKAEKLAELQRQAAQRGEGSLEAAARGDAGAVRQLGNELGDLAEAFGRAAARTGIFQATVGILRDGVGALNSFLPQTTRQLEGLENKLPDLASAFRQAADSSKRFADESLKDVADRAQDADDRLSGLVARLREQQRAALEVTNAQAARDLARVDLAEQQGQLAAPEAAQRRLEIQRGADARRRQIETQGLEEQIKALAGALQENRQTLADALQRAQQLVGQRSQAAAAADPLVQRQQAITAEQQSLRQQREALLRQREPLASEARFDNTVPLFGDPLRIIRQLPTQGGRRIRKVQSELAEVDEALAAIEERLGQLNEQAGALTPQAEAATEEIQQINAQLEAAREAYAKERDLLQDKNAQLEQQLQILRLQLDTAQTVGQIESQTGAIQSQARAAGQSRLAASQGLAADIGRFAAGFSPAAGRDTQAAFVGQLEQAATGLQDGADLREIARLRQAITDLFQAIDDKQSAQASALRDLASQVQTLESQLRANR